MEQVHVQQCISTQAACENPVPTANLREIKMGLTAFVTPSSARFTKRPNRDTPQNGALF